jgi:hypothetical protein
VRRPMTERAPRDSDSAQPQRSPRFRMGQRSATASALPTLPAAGAVSVPATSHETSPPPPPRRESANRQPPRGEPQARSDGSAAASSPGASKIKKAQPVYVVARESYEAESANHISLTRGDRVLLLKTSGDTFVGRTDFGDEGVFPAHVVAPEGETQLRRTPVDKKKVSLKEKMAVTLHSAASSAKSTAQAFSKSAKESGQKVVQRGKGIIAARSGAIKPVENVASREVHSSAHHLLHEELLRDRPELDGLFRVLLHCVVRPGIVAAVRRRRTLALTNPIPVKVRGGEVMLQQSAPKETQWVTFAHLMRSFGVTDVVENDAGWKKERSGEFGEAVNKFVESFFLLKELGGTQSQMCEESEVVHALLYAHLPKGHVLRRESDTHEGRTDERVVVLVCMIILRRGGLASESIFRSGLHEEASNALHEAIESNNEEAIETADCDVAAALLLRLLTPAMLPPLEECVKANDWSRAEEALLRCLCTAHLSLLVFLAAFFRLFRHADIVVVLVETLFPGCEPSQIQPLQDFVALILQHMPQHLVGEAAVGYHVVVTSRTTKKQARGKVQSYEKDKHRYIVRLLNGSDVAVKGSVDTVEWLQWGNLPDVPLLREAHLAPLVLEDWSGHRHPLHCMLEYYDTQAPEVMAFEAKLLGDEAFVVALIQSLDADKNRKHCLLGTVKTMVEVCCHRSLEMEFLEKVVAHFVQEEVRETESLGTLFRGSSAASRIISAFIDVVGGAMLKRCLSAPFGELLTADAERMIDKESLELGQEGGGAGGGEEDVPYEFIAQHAAALMAAIVEAKNELPLAVRRCCGLVAEIVSAKFADEEEHARRLAVGNVLFLRFFVPAMMSPVEAGLVPPGTVISSSVQGHSKVLTAAIQCIANQTAFSSAKASAVLNDLFIVPERERTIIFLEEVCAIDEVDPVASAAISPALFETSLFSVLLTSYLLKPDSLE